MKQALKLNATLFALLGITSTLGAVAHQTNPLGSIGLAVASVVALVTLNASEAKKWTEIT